MKKQFVRIGLFLIVPFLFGAGFVDDYYRFGLGARGISMGQSQTASVRGTYSLYWNPAGLGQQAHSELTSMSYSTFGLVQNRFFGGTFSLGDRTAISAGLFQTSLDGIEETTIHGTLTGDTFGYSGNANIVALGHRFDGSDTLLNLFSLKFLKGISMGVSAKQLKQSLHDQSGSATAVDLGFQYDLSSNLRLGALYQNFYQSGFEWDTGTNEDLSLVQKYGIAYNTYDLTLSVDYALFNDRDSQIMGGVEWRTSQSEDFSLSWRAGYREDALSIGLGMVVLGFDLDYVFLMPTAEVIDNHHLFSMSLALGERYVPEKVEIVVTQTVDVEPDFDLTFLDVNDFEWVTYLDMEGHSFKNTAEILKRMGILPNEAYLKPYIFINREYLAVQLYNFYSFDGSELTNLPEFPDVNKEMLHYTQIATMVANRHIPMTSAYFNYNYIVSRAEVLVSILSVLDQLGVDTSAIVDTPYTDMPTDPELNLAVRRAYAMGLIKPGEKFNPNRNISVVEFLEILSRTPPIRQQLKAYLKY